MYKLKSAGSLIITFCFFVGQVWANSNTEITANQIPHIEEGISVDGELTESVWNKALQVELPYEIDPGENMGAVVKTSAYIYEDGEYLYIGFNATDSQPEKIKAYLSERDDLWKSDYVGIALDTFNDSRRAFQFFTNAIGVQADSIINGITGEDDLGWDAIWQSAGSKHESGYSVEMAIPLKSLRFENNQDLKKWNIRFSRVWIRDVKYEFSNVKDDRNNDCNVCQYAQFSGLQQTSPASNLTLIPALTFSQSDHRDIQNGQAWQQGDLEDRESLDLRWGINQNVYLNATVNPDFSQVEADAIQLETNKRFAIFTTEKRAFFLDGADYFSNWSRLIHTKLFAEPEYGLKLTGKNGDHNYGIISLRDKDTNFLVPDNQSSRLVRLTGKVSDNQMFRYRYDLGKQGNIGFTYTQREADEYSNDMLSVDGKYWLNESGYLKFQVMTSDTVNPFDQNLPDAIESSEQTGDAFSVNYSHSARDWGFYLTHHQFDKGFRADSGFVSRSNWRSSSVELERHWYPEDQYQWWKSITLDLQWNNISDLDGNDLNDRQGIGLRVSGIYQSNLGMIYFSDKQKYVEQRFVDVPSLLLQQDYPVETYELFMDATPFTGLDISATVEWGDEIDFSTGMLGKIRTLSPSADYQLNNNWRFTLDYVNQSLEVEGENIFDIHLYNLRTTYQISVDSSLRFTLQGSKEGDNRSLASQLLYSYKVNPFTLFYVGYSDKAFQDLSANHLEKTDRTLFMKFSYAWQL